MSIDYGVEIPFVRLLGVTLEKFEDGQSVLHFPARPEHCNSFGVAHGGAIMTLLDICMATAARSVQRTSGIVTIEMKTSFLRPVQVQTGLPVVARGQLMHRTRSTAFVQGSVFDVHGELCAHGTGTFKYVTAAVAHDGSSTLKTD
jgi:uncharacterized protein (TIGR00369 family)